MHRDIKPENILLTAAGKDCSNLIMLRFISKVVADKLYFVDDIKISDFGLATMFMHEGRERIMETCCGTLPYVAPEVQKKSYRGGPVDVWSCGIVLVTMLVGELPWDEPNVTCKEFRSWREHNITVNPWTRISTEALCKT